jgi:hypothetical protein
VRRGRLNAVGWRNMAGRKYSNQTPGERVRQNNRLYDILEENAKPGFFGTPTVLGSAANALGGLVSPRVARINRHRKRVNKIIKSRKK